MDWVTCLKGNDAFPAAFDEKSACFRRGKTIFGEICVFRQMKDADFAPEQDIALVHHDLYAGVRRVFGFIDLCGFFVFAVAMFFLQMQYGENFAGSVRQRHILTFFEFCCFLIRDRQGNGERPWQPTGQVHEIEDCLIVRAPHESFEWAKAARRK